MPRRSTIAAAAVLLASCMLAHAQPMARVAIRPPRGGGPGTVSLPYMWSDNTGNQWMFYQYGQFMQQGNMPVYSQGAMLMVNNNYPRNAANMARMDDKTGELIFENMMMGNVNVVVTRRVLINKEEGWVRYVDIIKNNQNNEQTVNLSYQTSTNYGVQSGSLVPDPKKKDQNLAWVALTHANNRCVVEMYGGKGAKSVPSINWAQGNNSIQVTCAPTIPGGKEIALMHFHMTTGTVDAGQKFVLGMKESKMLASLPANIRRLIVNFRGGENFIGDYEILRGDILDVVELRSGDQLKGTLQAKSFKLKAFYGSVELPVDKVIGMINAGEFRPRQLIVTRDGEIYGGNLETDKMALELSSGQITEIPLSQISRMGYRKRGGESDEWTFDKPLVLMRSGDRICVQMPSKDVEVATRYGTLKLKPEMVAAISFQSEDMGVHQLFLTDGSHFAGLVVGDVFDMKLAGEGPEQIVKFPAASIRRLQLNSKTEEPDEDQAVLNLANDDLLVGILVGSLKLDTAFSTLNINAQEIKKLTHTAGSPSDVQIVLWDDTTISGQLQEQELACKLKSGLDIKVPVALIEDYSQPRPQPSAAVVETIKKLVAELNADDWKQRDAAREKLIAMGTVVINTLKQMRSDQSPEAQQGIDLVLQQLEKNAGKEPKDKPKTGTGPVPPAPVPVQLDVAPQIRILRQAVDVQWIQPIPQMPWAQPAPD